MINCPKCNEENPPKFRLCGYCGAPLVAAPPALPVREVRRTVTLIFCDLKGSTALAERLDPEAMHPRRGANRAQGIVLQAALRGVNEDLSQR